MPELTITRSKWDRGNSVGHMYKPRDGCSCAFGFMVVRLLNVDPLELDESEATGPEDVCRSILNCLPEILEPFVREDEEHKGEYLCTVLSSKILSVNDDTWIADRERELKLVSLFAEGGITLKFED